MLTLYDYELSGGCYAVRLLAGFLEVPLERVPIDFHPGAQHRSAEFLRLNPLGELPLLEDEGFVLRETQAMLIYLAHRHDPSARWLPQGDARLLADIAQWLAFAGRLTASAGMARLHDNVFHPADVEACRRSAHALLRIMDEHLWFAEQAGRDWLCAGPHATVADVACFPDVMLCEEGGIERLAYPAIGRWADRVKRIANFSLMAGIFPAVAAATSAPRMRRSDQ